MNEEEKLENTKEISKEKFDMFKLCLDESSKISDRRMKNNQFFLVINAAILSALMTLLAKIDNTRTALILFGASIFGILLSKVWKCSILSYKLLNDAKFEVINKMENDFPFKPFSEEWSILKRKEDYKILSQNEAQTSTLFFWAYCAMSIFGFISVFCK